MLSRSAAEGDQGVDRARSPTLPPWAPTSWDLGRTGGTALPLKCSGPHVCPPAPHPVRHILASNLVPCSLVLV